MSGFLVYLLGLIEITDNISDTAIPKSGRYETEEPRAEDTAGILIRYVDVIPNSPPAITPVSHRPLRRSLFL